MVTTLSDIVAGLRDLGVDRSPAVVAHVSLRSFGHVEGGAATVCRALVETCGTVLMTAGTWSQTVVPAPPGVVRPHNAAHQAGSWAEFEQELDRAVPYTPDLPVDDWLGRVAETMRQAFPHLRSTHPLFSYVAVGRHARVLVDAQRLDWPLGPLEALAELGGDVVLLGVGHTSNTTIHLAEQRLGRSRFWRYAKGSPGVWMELPNLPGESHRFDDLEPALAPVTREVRIGDCRARRVAVRAVLDAATRVVTADPGAMLCEEPACRCVAALNQRLAHLEAAPPAKPTHPT